MARGSKNKVETWWLFLAWLSEEGHTWEIRRNYGLWRGHVGVQIQKLQFYTYIHRRVYYDTNHKEAWWGNRGHRRCRSLREGACDLHRPIWMRKKAPKKKLRRRSPNPVRGLPTVFFLNFWLIWSPNQLKKKSRSPNCLFLNRLGDLFNQVGRLL